MEKGLFVSVTDVVEEMQETVSYRGQVYHFEANGNLILGGHVLLSPPGPFVQSSLPCFVGLVSLLSR